MKTKQTAVEWIEDNLLYPPKFDELIKIIDKAKQMEKEQIRSAYVSGFDDGEYLKTYLDLEYYNETYGKD
jgi:nitrate reductase assembly molybdenum cofactor insertion protein NarJ